MLQYFTKNFFSSLIVTGRLTATDDLEIFAVLDALEVPLTKVNVLLRVFAWDNFNPLVSVEFPLSLVKF